MTMAGPPTSEILEVLMMRMSLSMGTQLLEQSLKVPPTEYIHTAIDLPSPLVSWHRPIRARFRRAFISSLSVSTVVLLPRRARHSHGGGRIRVSTPILQGRPVFRPQLRCTVFLHRHCSDIHLRCHLHHSHHFHRPDKARIRATTTQIDSLALHYQRYYCDDHPGSWCGIDWSFSIQPQGPDNAE